jgi:hypothetical protein
LKRTRSQITSDLYILNWKSSYDVTLFICKSRSTMFRGILIFVIFRPSDMQEYIFMFSIAFRMEITYCIWKFHGINCQTLEWWSASIIGCQCQIQSEISGSAILFTNKCIRHRNIAFLQSCQLQIWQLSIANENTRYIIIDNRLTLFAILDDAILNSTHNRVMGRQFKFFIFFRFSLFGIHVIRPWRWLVEHFLISKLSFKHFTKGILMSWYKLNYGSVCTSNMPFPCIITSAP